MSILENLQSPLVVVLLLAGLLLMFFPQVSKLASMIKLPSSDKHSDCRAELFDHLVHLRDHLKDCPECVNAIDKVIAPRLTSLGGDQ